MITLGKWITKHKNIILLVAVILLVPSAVVMTFKLGTNIGIVMSKGVVIGVVACVTKAEASRKSSQSELQKTIFPPRKNKRRRHGRLV